MSQLRFRALADAVSAVRKYKCCEADLQERANELSTLLQRVFLVESQPAITSARLFFLPLAKVTDSSEKAVITEQEISRAKQKKASARKGTVMYLESDIKETDASSPGSLVSGIDSYKQILQNSAHHVSKIVATVRASQDSELVLTLETTLPLAPNVAPYFRVLATVIASKLTDNDVLLKDSIEEFAELYEFALAESPVETAGTFKIDFKSIAVNQDTSQIPALASTASDTNVLVDYAEPLEPERLQRVMDTIPSVIFWKDINGVYLGCNKGFATVAGFSSVEDIIGKTDFDMPWPLEQTTFYRSCDRKVIEENQPQFNIIEPLTKENGEIIWVSTSKMPMNDADGKVIGVLCHFEDITETMLLQTQREDFMASLAHDLKVPVIGAIRALDALLQGYVGPLDQKQIDFIQCLHRSHQNLLLMVKNLLQVLRYESGKDRFIFEHFDLVTILNESVKDADAALLSKHLTLEVSSPKKLIMNADRLAMKAAVTNLVNNAITSAPEHTQVKIDLQSIQRQAYLEVHNGGEPISEDDMEYLFHRLWQGKRFGAGAGLGLYLCRQVAEAHGGQMTCNSTREEGTVMKFSMPINAVIPAPVKRRNLPAS